MQEKRWTVEIFIDEHEAQTRATAQLVNRDDTGLTGVGIARLNPVDANVPEIGDELAASRALSELAHRLLDAAAADIEGVTEKPVHLGH